MTRDEAKRTVEEIAHAGNWAQLLDEMLVEIGCDPSLSDSDVGAWIRGFLSRVYWRIGQSPEIDSEDDLNRSQAV